MSVDLCGRFAKRFWIKIQRGGAWNIHEDALVSAFELKVPSWSNNYKKISENDFLLAKTVQ